MSSFKELRDLVPIAYDSKIISNEEFLVLFETCQSKNPELPCSSYPRIKLKTCKTTSAWRRFELKKRTSQFWQKHYRFLKWWDASSVPYVTELKVYVCCYDGWRILVDTLIWFPVWQISPTDLHDHQYRHGFFIWSSCPQTYSVESWYSEFTSSSDVCRCSVCTRCTALNCFRFVDGTVQPIARPG